MLKHFTDAEDSGGTEGSRGQHLGKRNCGSFAEHLKPTFDHTEKQGEAISESPAMDIVERILEVAKIIYGKYQNMKYCKKQKERLIKRMEILLRPIELLRAQSIRNLSPSLKWMLQDMLNLLLEAQELFDKYKSQNLLERFVKASDMLEEFADLNERFGDMGQGLLLQLQVEQKVLVSFEKCVVSKERCQDLAEDKVCWKEMLKGQQDDTHTEITEINKHFLTKMTFLMEMKDHILYKGEYYKSPVAIKVFKNPLTINTKVPGSGKKPVQLLLHTSAYVLYRKGRTKDWEASAVTGCDMTLLLQKTYCRKAPYGKVRQIFEEEIRTLKSLESSYIVRLYGICIDESGPVPQFSIITEYCEKGTLRDVLKKEPDMPWKIRTEMASDAAAGLYRLHQTGDKCQLHRCINSSKFLVAKGYCVKLSGFKLDQTESSISRKKDKVPREVSSLAYICPEGLASLHHPYNLASEIYSFGIVLWEIATGKVPFAGCNSQEIYKKVYKQKVQEPLGEDCPPYLQEIINQCRNYDPSKRPTAEVIVNQLLIEE
ncbi:mixed lineage kinase domain-like protein [Python bivittatus]|uniref:Mixed lineage kinase domain-like protein n=1 Tax=Python bivittatus TaxID=176946 RepID=A0A9F5MWJ7_PYTBI|nr:mixed lineage kinase domain-like protein [Python bivittatus]